MEKNSAIDLFKDIREGPIAPPEVMEKISKVNVKFCTWSPELEEECLTKQRATFVSNNGFITYSHGG